MAKNLTISKKLIGLISILLAMSIAIWANSVISMRNVKNAEDQAIQKQKQAIFLVEKEVDHLSWANALTETFILGDEFTKQLDPTKCDFGKWYYSYVKSDDGKGNSDEAKKALQEIEEPHRKLHESAGKIKEFLRETNFQNSTADKLKQAAIDVYKNETVPSLVQVRGSIKRLKEIQFQEMDGLLKEAQAKASSSFTFNLVFTLVSVILGLSLGLIIARSISKPLQKVRDMIDDIAQGEGDLTKRLEINSSDEIGALAKGVNIFIEKLHSIISQVASNTEQLASAANEISSSAEELSAGAKEQTNQTAQVSAAVEEMTATIVEASKNTGEAAEKAKGAATKSQEGSRLAADTSNGMDEIVNSANITAKNVAGLAEKATAIGEIISVIDDIADQTNLLALNAAIEAARAGEQGRGFAVVADEVRKLAERTTKATKEVAETIKGIQADVSSSNSQIYDSQKYVVKGKELVEKTNASLTDIFEAIEAVQGMMRQLASSSEQQSAAAEQISKSIENVNRITKESASGTEQAAAASEQLNRQAESLRQLVGGFKLRKKEIAGV